MRPLSGERLLIATHNAGKLEEMRAMFTPHGIDVIGAAEMKLPEPKETEDSFLGNALIKARAASKATGLPVLADDSGICVDALDGAPGVYTADWAETASGRDFGMAMAKTWRKLDEVNAPHPRTAYFACTLVVYWPDGEYELFEGKAPGHLVWPTRGEQGHGYDPMFIPDGYDETFAEMSPSQKNQISHRAHAFLKLKAALA